MRHVANLKRQFGIRVRALRNAKGLTQEKLGKLAKTDYKFIGALERGEKGVSFEVIERLAKALGVEPYKLFLPSDGADVDVEADIRAIAKDMGADSRANIQRFFQTVTRIMKKVDIGAR